MLTQHFHNEDMNGFYNDALAPNRRVTRESVCWAGTASFSLKSAVVGVTVAAGEVGANGFCSSIICIIATVIVVHMYNTQV